MLESLFFEKPNRRFYLTARRLASVLAHEEARVLTRFGHSICNRIYSLDLMLYAGSFSGAQIELKQFF